MQFVGSQDLSRLIYLILRQVFHLLIFLLLSLVLYLIQSLDNGLVELSFPRRVVRLRAVLAADLHALCVLFVLVVELYSK